MTWLHRSLRRMRVGVSTLSCLTLVLLNAGCSEDIAERTSSSPDCPSDQTYNSTLDRCEPEARRAPENGPTVPPGSVSPVDTGGPTVEDAGTLDAQTTADGRRSPLEPDTAATDAAGASPDADASPDTDASEEPASPYDRDGDGIDNRFDNCSETPNPEQTDTDGDGIGDTCDNCPRTANLPQKDGDDDGTGDACESDDSSSQYDPTRDADGDGVADIRDLCLGVSNPKQRDPDGDGVGSACDNCPEVANSTQTDSNNDGTGDACTAEPVGPTCGTQSTTFEGIAPNIYLLLDTSSSMHGQPLVSARQGLDSVAQALAPTVRFGFAAYPVGDLCNAKQYLPMGSHTASDIRQAYQPLRANGATPTGAALHKVRNQNWLSDASDSLDSQRPKVVVLITDGTPNACEGLHRSTQEAAALHKQGIDVYVVGFKSDASPTMLNRIAKEGGTDAPGPDRFFTANNSGELVKSLKKISGQLVSCSFQLEKTPPDPDKLWVEVEGQSLSRGGSDGFTYDASTNTIELSPKACGQLRTSSPNRSTSMKVTMGCASECEPKEEVCDYRDNDCDGDVDEGCQRCEPEVCDNKDNDCDGLVDEGCWKCRDNGERCGKDWECCHRNCVDGTCRPRQAP